MTDHPHIELDARDEDDAAIAAMVAEIRRENAERPPAAPEPVEVLATATVRGDGVTSTSEVRRVGGLVLHVGATTCSKPTDAATVDACRARARRAADRRAASTQRAPRRPAPASASRLRSTPRARGAGRPRATAARSSSRSGDSGPGSSEGSGDPDPPPPRSSTLSLRDARRQVVAGLIGSGRAADAAEVRRLLGWPTRAAQLAVADARDPLAPDALLAVTP